MEVDDDLGSSPIKTKNGVFLARRRLIKDGVYQAWAQLVKIHRAMIGLINFGVMNFLDWLKGVADPRDQRKITYRPIQEDCQR
jgi:hypothetical protein